MPISPEARFCLDGAVECLDMTADMAEGAFMMRLDVDAILDRLATASESAFADQVTLAVGGWMRTKATRRERRRAAAACLGALPMQFADLSDSVRRQIATLWLRGKGVRQPDRHFGCLTRRVDHLGVASARQACDPETICAFVSLQHGRFVGHLRQALPRCCDALRGARREDFCDGGALLSDQPQVSWVEAPVVPAEVAVPPDPAAPAGRSRRVRPRDGLDRASRNAARRALLKGIRRCEAMFGDGIRAFVAGKAMRVEGALHDYRLTRTSDNLVAHTARPGQHVIPYRLEIVAKAGTLLGTGCVYFQDTPIIDQVIALSLHVRERESEVALLRTAVISATLALADDPLLHGLRPARHRARDDEGCCTPDAARSRSDHVGSVAPRLREALHLPVWWAASRRFDQAVRRVADRPALRHAVRDTLLDMAGGTEEGRAVLAALAARPVDDTDMAALDAVLPVLADGGGSPRRVPAWG